VQGVFFILDGQTKTRAGTWAFTNVQQGFGMSSSCAVIILGHGTRRTTASQGFFALVDRIALRLAPIRVVPACFSCGQPTLGEQAAALIREKVSQVIIFPYFLLSGKHIADELPLEVQELRQTFPHARFDLLKTMEDEPLLETVVVTRLQGVVRTDGCSDPATCRDEAIIAGHFSLTNKPSHQFPLFKAMALATGDLALAAEMQVQGDVGRAMAHAEASQTAILCDTQMLTAGVRSLGLAAANIPQSPVRARKFLEQHMPGAVVAVGTNPFFIELVMDLVQTGSLRPGVLIGLPCGFTTAPAAKKRLAASDLVHITNPGSGGGIACVLGLIRALSGRARKGQDQSVG
jgi:precorrin isomerase